MKKIFFILLLLGLIGIQFIKIDKTNPPVTADLNAPDEVKTIFRNACYDCHSNETVWPWYSKVAPVSWMLENHVKEGREKLNFSGWEKFNDVKKTEMKKEIWEQISTEEMPIKMYTYLHTKANLDVLKKKTIQEWVTKKKPWE
jgi:hypothetical protein